MLCQDRLGTQPHGKVERVKIYTHVQPKAESTIDSKGHLGTPGATVYAAKLQLQNITLRHTALRPITLPGGHVESPLILGTYSTLADTL